MVRTVMIPGRSRKRNTTEHSAATRRRRRRKSRALLVSLAIIVISLTMITGVTWAWFHAKALTGASSVTTGFMNAELLMSEDDIKEQIVKADPENYPTTAEVTPEAVAAYIAEYKLTETYKRQVGTPGGALGAEETYHVITDKDVKAITLKNVEPGQVYPVHFYVANTGELAFTYSAGFRVDESITGLERLDREVADEENHIYGSTPEDIENNPDFIKRNRVLTRYQKRLQEDPEDPDKVTGYEGGHLEDVLKVYLVPEGISEGHEREVLTHDDDPDGNPYYVGTIAEIMGKEFEAQEEPEIEAEDGREEDGEEETQTALLNRVFTGYLLPESEVRDQEAPAELGRIIHPKHVTIVDESGTVIREEENAAELGRLRFIIVAPDDMNNSYQYAQLKISLGAYATQVEYETDGTGYRIYDRGAHETPPDIAIPAEETEDNDALSSPLLQTVLSDLAQAEAEDAEIGGAAVIDDVNTDAAPQPRAKVLKSRSPVNKTEEENRTEEAASENGAGTATGPGAENGAGTAADIGYGTADTTTARTADNASGSSLASPSETAEQ